LEYLEWVGKTFGADGDQSLTRAGYLNQALKVLHEYEFSLSHAVLDVLGNLPGCRIYGITDRNRLTERVPTFSFTLDGWHPRKLAERLNEDNIYVWDGNYYALAVTERLGLEGKGGMVRVGPVHYNTVEEVQRLGEVLSNL
jgi:selenocysteine lyase/cysteine desulfurase